MATLVFLVGIIILFAVLPVVQVLVLKRFDIDIIARLRVTSQTGGYRFFLEAFGVIAFILVQTIVLTGLFVWLSNNINPRLLVEAIKPISAIIGAR